MGAEIGMARIRSIKPEFPQSETIGRLSRDARLLFIQLWTIVDDEGRARAASRLLASLLYPYDDDAPDLIERWLSELEQGNCLRRYLVDGSQYLEIVNWLKHQKIDHPSASKIPPFDEASRIPREPSRTLAPDLGPRILDLGSVSCAVAEATRTSREKKFEQFKKAYPKRQGANPWQPARKLFDAAIRCGTDPDQIIAAAQNHIGIDPAKIGTEYVPQAVKWLRDKRYLDYEPTAPPSQSRPEGLPDWADPERNKGWRNGLRTTEEITSGKTRDQLDCEWRQKRNGPAQEPDCEGLFRQSH